MTSIAALLRETSLQLVSDSPRIDAELLLGFLLKKNSAWLMAHGNDELPPGSHTDFLTLLERRKAGEPIAHIIGSRGFWTLDLAVTSDTLIPRPETELLVELAISKYAKDKKFRVLDLGTGTGAIALAIAGECKNAEVIAVDKSTGALQVAKENGRRNNLSLEFFQSDWFAALENRKFDLIVSNPPYIPDRDPHLKQGDVRFEPITALASGADGLDDIRLIVSQSSNYCLPKAWLMIEHGYDQGGAIRALFSVAGFINIQTMQDLELRDRVTIGQWLADSQKRC
ncbi:MAG: peptide chain release factor N(5)-glutamine methyltransferase [Arenimonas sp.]